MGKSYILARGGESTAGRRARADEGKGNCGGGAFGCLITEESRAGGAMPSGATTASGSH